MKLIKRNIEITILVEDDESGFDPHSKNQSNAIGYLATWSVMSETKPEVQITIHTNGSVYGDYYLPDANGKHEHKYQIYAMKDPTSGEYSFHS